MIALQTRYKDSQLLLSELQSKFLPEQYELTKVAHEKKALESKVEYLEGELRRRAAADAEYRTAKDTKLYALETELSELKADLENRTANNASLKVFTVHAFG